MNDHFLAPNETMQLSELLTLKNLSLTKSIAMSPLVSDEELKAILRQDITTSERHVKELSALLELSTIANPESTCS